MNTNFHRVAVVGAGAMGQGIAQMCAQAGAGVWVHDVAPGAAEKACQAILLQWQKLQDKGRLTAADTAQLQERLHPATSLRDLADCDLVIEAVVENMAIKTGLFAELENLLSPQAVIATNTSSLPVCISSTPCP